MSSNSITNKVSSVGLFSILSLFFISSVALFFRKKRQRNEKVSDIQSWADVKKKDGRELSIYRNSQMPKFENEGNFSDLIESAILTDGLKIDMTTDILSFINGKIDELLDNGVSEICIVQGDALSSFIKQRKDVGYYIEITNEQLEEITNSVIIIALNENGEIILSQMIKSNGGISSDTLSQFNGNPVLKITLKNLRNKQK